MSSGVVALAHLDEATLEDTLALEEGTYGWRRRLLVCLCLLSTAAGGGRDRSYEGTRGRRGDIPRDGEGAF